MRDVFAVEARRKVIQSRLRLNQAGVNLVHTIYTTGDNGLEELKAEFVAARGALESLEAAIVERYHLSEQN